MIVFFSLLGIACKLRVPEAHTLLEIVRIRYGKLGHIVWIVLCLINNIIAVANMLLGASAAITALYVDSFYPLCFSNMYLLIVELRIELECTSLRPPSCCQSESSSTPSWAASRQHS